LLRARPSRRRKRDAAVSAKYVGLTRAAKAYRPRIERMTTCNSSALSLAIEPGRFFVLLEYAAVRMSFGVVVTAIYI
jgi:hypothetical protein